VSEVRFGQPLIRVTRRILWLILVLDLSSSAAFAQQSRADEMAQRQAQKSKQLAPNTASGMEQALNWFEAHFTNPNTVYLTFGGIYPGGGFAPGVAGRAAFGRARLSGGAAYSMRASKLAHGALNFPDLAGNRLAIETRARWMDAPQVPFYGLGADSSKDNRVSYGLRSLDVSGGATFKPVPWYSIGANVGWRDIEDRAGAGTRPSIETSYPAQLPGLFSHARYIQSSAFTAIDWRESPGYSRRGGLYSLALHDFRDRDEAFGFRRLDVDLRQLVPLLKEQWVLGFRALVQTTTADSGQIIPYYLLPSLGGAQTLRGYPDFRFQDKHLLLLGAEYRWLPSRIIDMALFVDSGKVTAERADLDLDGLNTTYGIGIRFHGPTFTPLRLDLARGDEGIRAHITGSVTF
jgi:hypothetical protein